VAKNKPQLDVKRKLKVQSAPVNTPHMCMTDDYRLLPLKIKEKLGLVF